MLHNRRAKHAELESGQLCEMERFPNSDRQAKIPACTKRAYAVVIVIAREICAKSSSHSVAGQGCFTSQFGLMAEKGKSSS